MLILALELNFRQQQLLEMGLYYNLKVTVYSGTFNYPCTQLAPDHTEVLKAKDVWFGRVRSKISSTSPRNLEFPQFVDASGTRLSLDNYLAELKFNVNDAKFVHPDNVEATVELFAEIILVRATI